MITIINIDNFIKKTNISGPVTSTSIFYGRSKSSFDPSGLFSENIFGLIGSKERKTNFSYIELNCNVIHPVIYDILEKQIFRNIKSLLSGTTQFSLDPNGILIETMNGELHGMESFYKNILQIRWQDIEENQLRANIIQMLYNNAKNNTFFMNKLLVIPPDFRPINIQDDKETDQMDPINEIYKKIISLSNQIKGTTGTLYDVLSWQLQLLIRDIYEYVRVNDSKKNGIIRKMMLGKRVDFSGRSVIIPNPKLNIGEIGIPLRMCCQLFEPHIIYGILNSKYSKTIPEEFFTECKKFLKKELSL